MDPMFSDVESYYFDLLPGSPCIGSGRNGSDRGAILTTTSVDGFAVIPSQVSLNSNYPNPFNASTTISYNLVDQSEVTLEIFDILGRKVQTLQNSMQAAGNHSLIWNATEAASGVYFYRLTTSSDVLTQRMTLIK